MDFDAMDSSGEEDKEDEVEDDDEEEEQDDDGSDHEQESDNSDTDHVDQKRRGKICDDMNRVMTRSRRILAIDVE